MYAYTRKTSYADLVPSYDTLQENVADNSYSHGDEQL